MADNRVDGPESSFNITFFENYAAATKTQSQWSLAGLARRIATTTAQAKGKLPWLKLATFGDVKTRLVYDADGRVRGGSLRHDANVLTVTRIEGDYDAEQESFEKVVDRLTNAGVLGLVYTSPSHGEEKPRWRVLCPLSKTAAPEVRSKMLGRLNGLYRGIFSAESWTLSQSYYYGSGASNPSHKVEVVEGTPIDLHDELDEIWAGKPNTSPHDRSSSFGKSGPIDEAALLEQIVSRKSYHAAVIRLVGKWAFDGVPLTEAKTRLIAAMEAVFPPDRDARWQDRYADLNRCILDVYGRQASKRDTGNDKARSAGKNTDFRWGDPIDFLADGSMPAPTLAEDHVPAALWPFVIDTAMRMGVDPSCVALAAIVSCSSVMSDTFEIQPKRKDYTWTEQARLWGAIVGEPSILKTPVISACTRPIIRLEAEARRQHGEQMQVYRDACEMAKAAKPPEPLPTRPKLNRFVVENATPEALSEVLRDDEEGKFHAPLQKVLCRHDEMSEFFAGLDRYKAGGKGGSERGSYLRLYNGGAHTVDRIGRGSFFIKNWSATFLGGVQPGPIQRIARSAADDGLLQRFSFAVPSAQERGLDRTPDHKAAERYDRLFTVLALMRPLRDPATEGWQTIVLSEGAHQHRERIEDLVQAMTCMPDISSRLIAAFGKWPGLFARLCLTFHLIDLADSMGSETRSPPTQVIQPEIAAHVARYMRDILLPHLFRAGAVMFSTDQTGHAQWIAGFILAHRLTQIRSRDLVRSYRPFKPPEAQRELGAVMRMLVSVGWLEPEEPSNPVKPVTTWMVNPAVHELFAHRAEAEQQRRAAIKARIADTVTFLRTKRRATA